MNIEQEFEDANKLLAKSKLMLNEYETKYPDDTKNIVKLYSSISDIQNQCYLIKSKLLAIRIKNNQLDWDLIQTNYNDYCETFSSVYLSGSEWYQYISKFKTKELKHGNFQKAYNSCKLEEYYSKNSEIYSDALSFIAMSIFV